MVADSAAAATKEGVVAVEAVEVEVAADLVVVVACTSRQQMPCFELPEEARPEFERHAVHLVVPRALAETRANSNPTLLPQKIN